MEDQQLENSNNAPKQLQPHLYKKGQSGNPKGRPKGSISLKQYAKKMLEQMTPEEREEYLQGLDKKFIWEMAEGKAETQSNDTLEVTLPTPLLANVPTDNSSQEDSGTQEKD